MPGRRVIGQAFLMPSRTCSDHRSRDGGTGSGAGVVKPVGDEIVRTVDAEDTALVEESASCGTRAGR